MNGDFELEEAESVTLGTVGVPGHRTFYLQARQGQRVITLKLEKQQVAALAQLLAELLADLPSPSEDEVTRASELLEPIEPDWVVGVMQLSYDSEADRIVLLAEELRDSESEKPGASGRLSITRGQAVALVHRGVEVVGAGRPLCPLCGRPVDPGGHACPRTNGHRPRRS